MGTGVLDVHARPASRDSQQDRRDEGSGRRDDGRPGQSHRRIQGAIRRQRSGGQASGASDPDEERRTKAEQKKIAKARVTNSPSACTSNSSPNPSPYMAKARALDKRRKSIRNIRKITRTMELIATARFKKAMDRASAATAYTKRITELVADLANSGLEVSHPLLEGAREDRARDAAGAHRQSRAVRRLQWQRRARRRCPLART